MVVRGVNDIWLGRSIMRCDMICPYIMFISLHMLAVDIWTGQYRSFAGLRSKIPRILTLKNLRCGEGERSINDVGYTSNFSTAEVWLLAIQLLLGIQWLLQKSHNGCYPSHFHIPWSPGHACLSTMSAR